MIRMYPATMTTLLCQAVHPSARRDISTALPHRVELTTVPFACVSTGRTFGSLADVPLGMIGAWCPACKRASEYRVVVPVAEAA